MSIRSGSAAWQGGLKRGSGEVATESGALQTEYSFASRFESEPATNPEELIAAAHAGCFAMAFAHGLEEAGYQPQEVRATAQVRLEQTDGEFHIPSIELECEAQVPDIDEEAFAAEAENAKENCPVSKLLAGAEITLSAHLLS